MKQRSLLLLALLACFGINVLAYDFKENGITYRILPEEESWGMENQIEVTSGGDYTGDIIIPSDVYHNGTHYNVARIGTRAFENCTGITSVSGNLWNIGDYAFSGCINLTSISSSNDSYSIGQNAFEGCINLKTAILPTDYIGYSAYEGCTSISTVKIPINNYGHLNNISRRCFYGCSSLQTIAIPSSVTYIEEEAFAGSGLTSIVIPDNIISVGDNAFAECPLISIKIGKGLNPKVGMFFDYNKPVENNRNNINQIIVDEGNPFCDSRNNCNAIISSNTLILGCKNTIIPSTVTAIGEGAFNNCPMLAEMDIPNGIVSIGRNAFAYCSRFSSINLPNSVEIIGSSAFMGCEASSIYIGSGVREIEAGAFLGVSPETIKVSEENNVYDSRNDCNAIVETSTNKLILGCINTIIPEGIKVIGQSSFRYQYELKSINIPASLKEIEWGAFADTNLSSVHISSMESWCNIKFDSWEANPLSIAGHLYMNDGEITNLVIPDGVTDIRDWSFYNCKSLVSVTVPNNVINIGKHAFANCENLTSLSIGKNIAAIGESVFDGCDNLVSVTMKSKNPVSIKKNVFTNRSNATLFVPKGSVEAYQAADYWKEFKSIEEIDIPTYKLTYLVDNVEYKVYEMEEGESIAPEPEPVKDGYTFSGWSEIPEKMPAHDVIVTGTLRSDDDAVKSVVIETAEGEKLEFYISENPSLRQDNDKVTLSSDVTTIELNTQKLKKVYVSNANYKIIYLLDGEVYKTYFHQAGVTIRQEPAPTKEGYEFSGWGNEPNIMPKHDVTVTGSFSVGQYSVTYMVDEEIYKVFNYDYGAAITPEPSPEKEGYTFSGWSTIPETMPAHDVTITGTFKVNKYKVNYFVDNTPYYTDMVDYGATITPPTVQEREGYDFAWGYIPDTMPANDISIYGYYTLNTGIDKVVAHRGNNKEYVFLSGLQSGETVCVFSISGEQVISLQASADGELTLSLAALTQGIYIIKTNRQTIKVTRK